MLKKRKCMVAVCICTWENTETPGIQYPYAYACVLAVRRSRPMERCSRTLNSAARLVATNCKKVGPKCSADDNMKYWHKCPKIKILQYI